MPNSALTSLSKLALIVFAIFGSFGFTDCQYFSTVQVPSSDTRRPSVLGSVVDPVEGTYLDVRDSASPLDYRVDYDRTLMLVASTLDSGGARSLEVTWTAEQQCCDASRSCQKRVYRTVTTTSDWQPGGVGSSVSNGIWLYQTLSPRTILEERCGSLARTSRAEVSFEATARDFRGNVTNSARHRAYYRF